MLVLSQHLALGLLLQYPQLWGAQAQQMPPQLDVRDARGVSDAVHRQGLATIEQQQDRGLVHGYGQLLAAATEGRLQYEQSEE